MMSRLAEDVTSAANVAVYAKPLGGVLRAAIPRSTRRKRAMSSIERRMRALLGEAATGDGAEAFIEQTKALLKLKGRQIKFRNKSSIGNPYSMVAIDFFNLPEGYRDESEQENNRVHFQVTGFDPNDPKAPPPSGKVRVELRFANVGDPFGARINLRAKSAPVAQAAKYVADFINKIVEEFPPKYTHSKPPLGEASRGEGPHATYTDFQDQCDAAFLAAFADVMASKGFRTKINAGEPLYAEFKNAEFEGMAQLIAASMNDIEAHVAIKSVAGGKKQFYKRSFKMKALSPMMLADVVLKDWLGKPGKTRAGDI